MVRRSSNGPTACWILAQFSAVVTVSLNEMRFISRWHLISSGHILLSSADTYCTRYIHMLSTLPVSVSDHSSMARAPPYGPNGIATHVLRLLLTSRGWDCEVSITYLYRQLGRKRCRSYRIYNEQDLEQCLDYFSGVSTHTLRQEVRHTHTHTHAHTRTQSHTQSYTTDHPSIHPATSPNTIHTSL